ncbi:MAG TPA: acyloxyacyl hydrolase [Candidatus Limnocylindrales bacterium]|jgi:opacity protein-like surface antigen|nr:acyloxyacyl hydrolase [Candidatus Limnocylindrales bacterium]
MRKLGIVGWVIFVASTWITPAEDKPAEGQDSFAFGRYEGTLTSGVMFSPFIATHERPTINYTITEAQFGCMLGGGGKQGWYRGSFEFVTEGFGSAIFQGSGNYIAGVTFWARYNFVQPDWRIVPYIQAGAGVTVTDIDREVVGQAFNFNLDVGLGARYLFSPRWAMLLEYRYQHISNANSAAHNLGINAQGAILGVSYLF